MELFLVDGGGGGCMHERKVISRGGLFSGDGVICILRFVMAAIEPSLECRNVILVRIEILSKA